MYNSNTNRNEKMNKRKVILIGYSYDSFEEYIQLNYMEEMKNALTEYIKEKELNTCNNHVAYLFNLYWIQNIQVLSIKFTKSQVDKVEFNVRLKAEYELVDSNEETGEIETVVSKKEYFLFKMNGSFKKGFKGKKKEEIERLDQEPDEILSSGLVPIIHTEEMDKYATKFLKEFCPEALITPMKLNIPEMLKKMQVEYYYAPLGEGIFGKTYFANDKVRVFTEKLHSTEEVDVKPGTILVDVAKHIDRNEGSFRNTLIHECVHWFFHRNYFELRQCLNAEDTYIACYKSVNQYQIKDIEWMEWQARTMAPRILMPKKMSIQKITELKKEVENEDFFGNMTKTELWEEVLKRFAKFFGASIFSAKIRIKELGFQEIEGIKNYIDDEYIPSFFFKKGVLKKNQTFLINNSGLAKLLTTNLFIQDALQSEKLLYINKMLVANNPKYVNLDTYELTDYAKEHAHECAVIFTTKRLGINENGLVDKQSFLFSSPANRKEISEVDSEQLLNVIKNANVHASHFESHKNNLPMELGATLEYHYKKAKENKILHSYEEYSFECDLDIKTIRAFEKGERTPNRTQILKMAFGLRLSSPYIIDLLQKGDCAMTKNSMENTLLTSVMLGCQRKGLPKVYKQLYKVGMSDILGISENYLINHNLI